MERKRTIWSEHLVNGVIYHELPEESMYEFLVKKARPYLNDIAIDFEGKKTTYSEFLSQIDTIARGLLAQGIKREDIVTIVSPNITQAVAAIYAVNKIGAVANILHPLLSAKEIQHHIEKTESRAVFIYDMFYEKVEKAEWNIPQPIIILMSIPDALSFPKKLFAKRLKLKNKPPFVFYWKEFINGGITHTNSEISTSSPDDVALILYSGGTTGESKGIMLTNKNINAYAVGAHEVGECICGVKSLAVMPIFHGFGLCSAVHNMLTCGSHLYLLPKYDMDKCNKLIFKEKIACIFAVPAIYDALIYSKEMQTKDYSFLKYMFCGGDKLKIRSEQKFNEYMKKINSNTRIVPGYGLTECVAGCLSNALFITKEGTAGMAFPDAELKIVEPGTENELPVGQEGELCLCAPTVMKGYFKDEEATRRVLRVHKDGKTWLHTGDVFFADTDGFYTFCCRLSRMFVVNGYNVYPEQIENVIVQLPIVAKCCVVGEETKIGGTRSVVVVSFNTAQAEERSEEDLLREVENVCKTALPEYIQIQRFVVVDTIPQTKIGKNDFKKVAELIRN